MALGDIKIVDAGGHNVVPTRVYQTDAGATAIKAGEPVILTTIGTSVYAAPAADADPTIGTDYIAGIAAGASTHTASADGTVEVYLPLPGVIYRGKAKSAAAADTEAEILALANKRGVFDLTTGVYTLDTAAADGATNGLIYTGTGNPATSEVDFMISIQTTNLGF
jgi:hypothetical protein